MKKFVKLFCILLSLFFIYETSKASDNDTIHYVFVVKQDITPAFQYRIVYDSAKKKCDTLKWKQPNDFKLYKGERFNIWDKNSACFVWRDSIVLPIEFNDTTIRRDATGQPLKDKDGKFITKSSVVSLFKTDTLGPQKDKSIPITVTTKWISDTLNGIDSIMVVIFKNNSKSDSCLIINEMNSFALQATLKPGETRCFTLPELGLSKLENTCVFRISPSNAVAYYLILPSDLDASATTSIAEKTFLQSILKYLWIGLIIVLLFILAGFAYLFLKKRKQVEKPNEEQTNTDNKTSENNSSQNKTTENEEVKIEDNEQDFKRLLELVEKLNDFKPIEKANQETTETEIPSDATNLEASDSANKADSFIEQLRISVNEIQTLSSKLRNADNQMRSGMIDLQNRFTIANEGKIAAEAKVDSQLKTIEELQDKLEKVPEEKSTAVKEAEDRKQKEIDKLNQKLDNADAEKMDAVKEAEDRKQAVIDELNQKLDNADAEKKKAVKEAEDRKQAVIDKQKQELDNAAAEKKRAVKAAEDKKQAVIDDLNQKLTNADAEKKKAVKAAEDKKQAVIDELNQKLDNAAAEKNRAVKEAEDRKQVEIDKLNKDLKFYSDNFTRVEFAQAYAKQVKKLFATVTEMERAANSLMTSDNLDDPYYLYRAQAKYNQNLDKVNKLAFCSEIDMMARGQLIPKDSKIVNLKSSEADLKNHLFNAYLENYVNAVVVFNESIIGLPYFDQKLSEKNVSTFKDLQKQLEKDIHDLDLVCVTAHIKEYKDLSKNHPDFKFDIMDMDSGFKSGEIISIENCRVSMKGGSSNTTIKAVVQQ